MKKLPLRKLPLWVYRLIIACAFGAAITFTTLSAEPTRLHYSVMQEQENTRRALIEIKKVLDNYQKQNHKPPHTLNDMVDGTKMLMSPQYLKDGWNRPYFYKVQGTYYSVSSYGQDGKPGGEGLDIDLTTDNPNRKAIQLTPSQFLNHPLARKVANLSKIGGILATMLCFIVIQPVPLEKRTILPLLCKLLLLFVFVTFMALMMTLHHIPSGH